MSCRGARWRSDGFRFPLHYENSDDLILSIKKQVERIKVSPEPGINAALTSIVSKLPANLMLNLMLDNNGKVTSMLSNVRGPSEAVSVCGYEVQDLRFYASAPIGLYFGVLTYNGKLTASVALDRTCDNDASRLAKHWKLAFDKLYADTMTNKK